MAQNTATSVLGIIALIAVIVAAVVFIYEQTQDDELEIDIGVVTEASPRVVADFHVFPIRSIGIRAG